MASELPTPNTEKEPIYQIVLHIVKTGLEFR